MIPCYNEQEVVRLLRREIESFLNELNLPYELILVNDGSRDSTLSLFDQWAEENPSVKVLGFARNFGHQIAVTAGLDIAKGDAVVMMDADLQDPPRVVYEMLQRYQEGYDVVYGQREERTGESAFKNAHCLGLLSFSEAPCSKRSSCRHGRLPSHIEFVSCCT